MSLRRLRFLWLLALTAFAGCRGADVDRLLADLVSEDVTLRRAAAQDLALLAPAEPRVITALQAAAQDRDRDVRRLACVALGETRNGLEELTASLDDSEMSVRLAAAYALLKIEPDNGPAIEELTKAMKLGDGGVIVAVTRAGPSAQWAIPTLIELLRDDRPGIRRLAVDGLGNIGVASPEVFAALQRARQDQDDRVRESVAAAIDQINGV